MNGSSLLPLAPPTPREPPISVHARCPPQPERLSSSFLQATDLGLSWASVFANGGARPGLGKVDQKRGCIEPGDERLLFVCRVPGL